MNNFAHLNEESQFYPLFEGGRAPIKNILVPAVGIMEGSGVHEFYWLDVAKCSDEQIGRIAYLVALQCGGLPLEVEEHIRKEGTIPLRAMHVRSVSTDSMAFL